LSGAPIINGNLKNVLFHYLQVLVEPARAEPFTILGCNGRLMALPRNVRLERYVWESHKNEIFFPFSGCIQTLELRIMSKLFYHCATRQLFVEPFMVLCCNGRLIIALPPYIMLEMHDES
jgi:hypothetical protein